MSSIINHTDCYYNMYHSVLSTDTTLTSANLKSALASLNDDELGNVLGGISGDSGEQMIVYWIMTFWSPTWEYVAGMCFIIENENALEEVKKHFKRNLGMSLTQRKH